MLNYLIDTAQMKTALRKHSNREMIIQGRPSCWKTFFLAFLRLNTDIGFIELPEEHLRAFHHRTKFFASYENLILINGDWYKIKAWTFYNLCHFCLESLQVGFFWNLKRWRWS
jgi:hypothetical protein